MQKSQCHERALIIISSAPQLSSLWGIMVALFFSMRFFTDFDRKGKKTHARKPQVVPSGDKFESIKIVGSSPW